MNPAELLAQLSNLYAQRDLLGMKKREVIDQVITPEIVARLSEIDAEFQPQEDTVKASIELKEAEVKQAVLEAGKTVSAREFGLQAVYIKGRVSWNVALLEGYALANPIILQARSEGSPSVQIRKV